MRKQTSQFYVAPLRAEKPNDFNAFNSLNILREEFLQRVSTLTRTPNRCQAANQRSSARTDVDAPSNVAILCSSPPRSKAERLQRFNLVRQMTRSISTKSFDASLSSDRHPGRRQKRSDVVRSWWSIMIQIYGLEPIDGLAQTFAQWNRRLPTEFLSS